MRRFANFATPALVGLALLATAIGGLSASRSAAESARLTPAPLVDEAPGAASTEVAVFAGGCFWGVQGVFQRVEGVTSAVSGYAGGAQSTAQYEAVGSGRTGHAEAVRITYDPRKISYGKLLQIYFSVAHDPTELNRQGPDVGTQYRSAIFPANPAQSRLAASYIAQLDGAKLFHSAIATRIEPDKIFYPAEAYHQDYLTLNPGSPYIAYYDLPKIEDLQRLFPQLYREKPVLVSAR